MTIDSVAITRAANFNSGDNTIRVPAASLSGSVPLTVPQSDLNYETRVVSNGVLLPVSGVSSTSQILLKNESGTEIDAEFYVLANWPDGSIKSVKVIAPVSASSTADKIYTLDWGVGVSQGTPTSNLGYTEDSTTITVSTGNARFVVSKDTGMIIEGYADTAGDQSYATQVLDGCELFQQDAKDDTQYSSDNEAGATVSVTRAGVMEIEIYVVGRTRDVSNNSYTEYRIWHVFQKDAMFADTQYTMIDDRPQVDVLSYFPNPNKGENEFRELSFECRNLGLKFSHTIASGHQYIFGGESNNATGSLTGEEYLLQSGARNYNINDVWSSNASASSDDATGQEFNYSGVQSGEKAKGFCTIHNGSVGVSLLLQNFWEEWPRELSMDTSTITASFFPDRYHNGTIVGEHSRDGNGFLVEPNTLYHQYTGMAKTYRIRVLLHKSAPVASRIQDRLDDLNFVGFNLRQDAQTMCDSEAFYPMIPANSESAVHDTTLLNEYLLYSQNTRPHRVLPYGWRYYGNKYWTATEITFPIRMSALMGGSHYQPTQHYAQYARTIESAYFREAHRQTRMFMDLCVNHGEVSAGATVYSAMEPLPPGLVRNGNHKDVDQAVIIPQDTHNHCGGLYEYYILTGDPRAKQVLTSIGLHHEHLIDFKFPVPIPPYDSQNSGRGRPLGKREAATAERQFGWVMHNMVQYVKMSNDAIYHRDVSSQSIKFLLGWWKEGGTHYINAESVGTCDYTQGTGTWLQYGGADNTSSSFFTNGNSPFMLPSMLCAVLHWYDNELLYGNSNIDLLEVREMLYQVIQFVNYWGWHSSNQGFVYSMRPGSAMDVNGNYNLASPMTRIYTMCRDDKAAGNLSNPQWYDTATWKSRILYFADLWKDTPKGSLEGPGIYGYEHLFDMSFWKYLESVRAE